MGYIYKITNEINNKVYIGQTIQTLKNRWYAHKSNSKKSDFHLYRAMRLYGVDKFHIEAIEEVDDHLLNEREQYWIQIYDSYRNGYNSNIGGNCGSFESTPVYQYDLNGNFISKFESANDAERKLNILHQNILKACKSILNKAGGFQWRFEYFDKIEPVNNKVQKSVYQYDSDKKLIKIWDKVKDAAESIGVEPTHISRACRSGYKCHGYYWSHQKI